MTDNDRAVFYRRLRACRDLHTARAAHESAHKAMCREVRLGASERARREGERAQVIGLFVKRAAGVYQKMGGV